MPGTGQHCADLVRQEEVHCGRNGTPAGDHRPGPGGVGEEEQLDGKLPVPTNPLPVLFSSPKVCQQFPLKASSFK